MAQLERVTWRGDERRSGHERRSISVLPELERRGGERRRGGIGTSHPDPTAALLGGIEAGEELAFEPREAGSRGAGSGRGADAGEDRRRPFRALPAGWIPAHEPHDAIPAVAQIGGHPMHPMLVPLPIGALAGAVVSDLAYAATGDRFFARASRLLTGAGLVTGVAAAMLGGVDFLGRSAIRSHTAAWVHAGGNVAALVLGAASLAARAGNERRAVVPVGMALSLATGAILVVTGWMGGELSYRHRIGVTTDEA